MVVDGRTRHGLYGEVYGQMVEPFNPMEKVCV